MLATKATNEFKNEFTGVISNEYRLMFYSISSSKMLAQPPLGAEIPLPLDDACAGVACFCSEKELSETFRD